MRIHPAYRTVARAFEQVPLRTILIVAFVLQIAGTVGLVGYLSFKNGQQAVNEVASQLRSEISNHIERDLRTHLERPFQILQTNQDIIAQGMLSVENLDPWESYLWRQKKLYNHASVIGVGNEQGNYRAVEKLDDSDQLAINISDQSTGYSFHTYITDTQGQGTKLIRDEKNFDPRLRPWYQAAVMAGQPTWSEIYPNIDHQTLNIAAVRPVYEQNRLVGVLLVTERLIRLSEYLQNLKIGKTGKAFIIERSGMVVATSSGEKPFRKNQNTAERLRASESSDPLTQATAKYLFTRFRNLNQIQDSQQLEFNVDGRRQFLQVLPFQDSKGLELVIVVVVPEADFMQQINANIQTTILLCIAAFIAAVSTGIMAVRWITKPILPLNTAAKGIAKGEWGKTVEIERSDEVGQLAESFNQMAAQLQESFAALRESENRLTQFLEAVPVGVMVHDATGKSTYANQTAKQILGIDKLLDTQTEKLAEDYQVYLSGTNQLYPIEKLPVVRALAGESRTVDDLELHRQDRVVPLEVWATPIYDEAGKVVYAIVAFVDITERKQAQQCLSESNRTLEKQFTERTAELIQINKQLKAEIAERQAAEFALNQQKEILQTIFENIPVMLVFYNANVEVQLINKAFKNTLGWSLEEIREFDIMSQCYPEPDYRASVIEFMMRADGTWQDIQLRTRNGNRLFTAWANVRLPNGSIVGIGQDITERKQAEEELRENKHLIERIANASPNLWYIYDHIEQRNVYTNRELAAVLGYTPEQMQEMGSALLPTIVHPDDYARFSEHLKQWKTALDDDILEIEYRIRNARAQWRTLLTRESVFERSADGTVKQVIGTSIDISDRKQIEEALKQSALREKAIACVLQRMRETLDINTIFSATTEELRHVLNCDRVAIYRFNPDWSGEFVAESVADGWVPLVVKQENEPELKEDVLEDKNCTIKTLKIENDSVQDTYLQDTRGGAYAQGVNYRVTQDIYSAGFTPCYINLLERFQVRAYIIVPIFYGSQLWGLLATYQNLTPRCWSEAQVSAVVQIGIQLGVALQQAQLLQHSQQQAVALELALEELKRTQTQLIQTEKMSSLGQLIAGIAHEINNPVSFIYGNLTPARDYFQDLLSLIQLYQESYPHPTPEIQQLESDIEVDYLVEDWQRLIDSMQVGAERIRQIVLSLRNFSRLDEKGLKTVDLHEGIENTLLILQHRLKAQGSLPAIQVIKNYGQLPLISCYASQLNQVFMNLLSNAIDALRQASEVPNPVSGEPPTITIHTDLTDQNHSPNPGFCLLSAPYIIIRIADNGLGMSETVKQKIFDPFFTTKPVGSGTGLGLSISYQIVVEKHKGQISCRSSLGQGTEFIVQIPVTPL